MLQSARQSLDSISLNLASVRVSVLGTICDGLAKRRFLLQKFGNAVDQVVKVTGVGSRIVPLLCTAQDTQHGLGVQQPF